MSRYDHKKIRSNRFYEEFVVHNPNSDRGLREERKDAANYANYIEGLSDVRELPVDFFMHRNSGKKVRKRLEDLEL